MRPWLLTLALLWPLSPALAAETPPVKRAMTPENLWALERVGGAAVSPDGRWAVYSVTVFSVDKNRSNADLWLVPTDGSQPPRRLTWNEGSDGSPVWSPDGRRLAFVSKRGDGPPQLYLLPLEGGEAEPVTDLPVGPAEPRWFPDGQRIGFLASTWPETNDDWKAVKERLDQAKDDKTEAKISDTRLLRFWDSYKTDGMVSHLFVLDLSTRKVRDLTPGSRLLLSFDDAGDWDLAPDGREAAFAANATAPPYRTLDADVFTVAIGEDGAPGPVVNLSQGPRALDEGRPRYSPDGRFLVYSRSRRVDFPSDFSHLVRRDRASGEARELASGWDGQAADWTFSPDGQSLYFVAEERGRQNLFRLGIEGGQPVRLAQGGVLSALDVGGAGAGKMVLRRESITQPPQLVAVDPTGGEPVLLADPNAARLAELDLGRVEEATFLGAGGASVHLFLVLPPGFDPGKKWPLLHFVHGGPHGAFRDDFHFRWNAALAASRGHVVAMVNFHGSTGYGQAFADAIVGAHAEKPFEDVMAATDHLLARGFIDPARMAAAGGSYGGYLVSWILGHTDRFAALIDHAGVYDLMSQFASDATWGRDVSYGAAPWSDPARIDLYSPSRFAANFVTPTLILHGEKDFRVPVTQGINLYGVLQAKGVPSRIVIFPNENHWVLKPKAALLWWQEVFAWLERYAPGGGR